MFSFSNTIAANLADLVDYAYTLNSQCKPGTYPVKLPQPTPSGYTIQALAIATDTVFFFEDTVFYGIVASSPTEIVIAIRGTGDSMEWALDFDFTLTGFSYPGTKVETGFYSIYQSRKFVDVKGNSISLQDLLTHAIQQNPALSVIVVAHSLGGALASMMAFDLAQTPAIQSALSVITMASPAPGDDAFAARYNQCVSATYRIWNPWDVVPYAPPCFLGFQQVAGAGQKLSPTSQELEEYDFFLPECNHSLLTYQWLLDPPGHPLTQCMWPWEATDAANRRARMQSAVQRIRQRAQAK